MYDFLRDPIWQGIGAILAFISLITYLAAEREKIFSRRPKEPKAQEEAVIRKEFEVSLPKFSLSFIRRPLLGKWIISNIIGWGYAFVVAAITSALLSIKFESQISNSDELFGIFAVIASWCLTQSFTQWRFLKRYREGLAWWVVITPLAFVVVYVVLVQFINIWAASIIWTIFSWIWGYGLIHDREPIS